ncbi:transposase family protein [Methylosinus sporium]|uniref:transposase family protein n=1 Tax=Methylosinus sporium TaxID=428 RepID=UPI00383B29E4
MSVAGPEVGACPGCNERSTRRHSRYVQSLLDLPIQGSVVDRKAPYEPAALLERRL